jgi:hypothetical protein
VQKKSSDENTKFFYYILVNEVYGNSRQICLVAYPLKMNTHIIYFGNAWLTVTLIFGNWLVIVIEISKKINVFPLSLLILKCDL